MGPASRLDSMEILARIPKDRIGVLIGRRGETRKRIEAASGAKLDIDSESGDVIAIWEPDTDPIVRMKMPDLIKAIGRGLAPTRAIQLLEDNCFLRLYDMREWVGKQPNQLKRMRGRVIGREGKIRAKVEQMSGAEIAVYGSTVCVIGDEEALAIATPAIERILRGSEFGNVIQNLEKERRRQRFSGRSLESIQLKGDDSDDADRFASLVPGLHAAKQRRNRHESQNHDEGFGDEDEDGGTDDHLSVDAEDSSDDSLGENISEQEIEEGSTSDDDLGETSEHETTSGEAEDELDIDEMMELAEDESVEWAEE
jgi:ribosomal RNA assembly protein